MRYMVGIACVNRFDLLYEAVNSIRLFWENTIIIDNSPNGELKHNSKLPQQIQVLHPTVPLNFTQVMNCFQRIAFEKQCDVLMIMHNDARAHDGTPEKLLSTIESLNNGRRKWGVVFTNYDVLCAFNMEAIRAVGEWDTAFPNYFSDNDYYRRIRLAGFETVDSGLPVEHHGSSTIKSDPYRMLINRNTFPLYKRLYQQKWGGKPGAERFTRPYNYSFPSHEE